MTARRESDPDTVGARYASVRGRLTGLLEDCDPSAWDVPVPACPGWRVRDVLAHLVGNLEDGAAGRISGPPSTEQTDAQVERHRDDDPRELLATWGVAAQLAEPTLSRSQAWPAFIDALSHEHDIRAALGQPGARDHRDVLVAAALVGEPIERENLTVVFDVEGRPGDPTRPVGSHTLRTDPFELVRLRLGRRSAGQVRALDWSADPEPVLAHVFVFGPSDVAINE